MNGSGCVLKRHHSNHYYYMIIQRNPLHHPCYLVVLAAIVHMRQKTHLPM